MWKKSRKHPERVDIGLTLEKKSLIVFMICNKLYCFLRPFHPAGGEGRDKGFYKKLKKKGDFEDEGSD